jgi:hypothetical protein
VPRKLSRILWTTLAVLVTLVIIAFLLGSRLSSSKSATVEAGWDHTLGSREEILERFPLRHANDAAMELERLTAALGIDIASRIDTGRARPLKETARRFAKIKPKLGNYLQRQIELPRRTSLPPPEQLISFLKEEEETLAAIRRHLLEGDLPRWGLHVGRYFDVAFPNRLGHVNLQKLLVADAMIKNVRGESAEALLVLEAGWRLNGSIRDDPYLITQLVAISITRLHAGALRQIRDVPDDWKERLNEHDFRDSFFTAMLLESWHWTQIEGPEIFDERTSRASRLAWMIARPYARYCLADLSDDYRERLMKLADGGATCDYYLVERQESLDVPVPFWNVMGVLVQPNILGALDRLARLELDLELTGKVLRLKNEPWDERLEPSVACPRDNWLYGTGPEGTKSIEFSREISWPDQTGAILPTKFSVESTTTPDRALR